MRHSQEELFDEAYRYYPRGIPSDDPRYRETDEHLRLVAARRRAGAERGTWQALLSRLEEKFPGNSVQDDSFHLVSGNHDACYSGSLHLPKGPGEHDHRLVLMVSFIVRYYTVFSVRVVEDVERTAVARASQSRNVSVFAGDTCYVLPSSIVKPEIVAEQEPIHVLQNDIRFDLSPNEQPYGSWFAREVEATWGYERMPPEVGTVVVPDLATNSRKLGEVTLYDCLFSDER